MPPSPDPDKLPTHDLTAREVPTGARRLSHVLDSLRADGYQGSFSVQGPRLRCDACGHLHDADEVVVQRMERFEGVSDPDDEALLAGLRCRSCGGLGVLVAAYGPAAGPDEAEVVRRLPVPPRT